MQDNATVSVNTSRYGGGVFLESSGTFTMIGGTVYGNDDPLGNNSVSGLAALEAWTEEINYQWVAKYGNGSNIFPLTDGYANGTNKTIIGRK